MEGETSTFQVAIPQLWGKYTHHMITYQKPQLIPELHEQNSISVALAVADEEHWNIVNDPMYPACLDEFKRKHMASQAPQAEESTSQSGVRGEGLTLETTLSSMTSSRVQSTSTPDDEIRDKVHEILGRVFALRIETM